MNRRKIGDGPDAVLDLPVRAVTRDMRNGHDAAFATLMSGGPDYAMEILARLYEAHWIDALECEIQEVFPENGGASEGIAVGRSQPESGK